jgi:V8-like Glu-specific endopeptidase
VGAWPILRANTFTAGGSCPGDTRSALIDDGAPWRCIGKLTLPHHRFMTATLVGPDLILTAAHGLVKNGQLIAGDFVFHPNFGNKQNPTTKTGLVKQIWLGTFTPERKDSLHSDWALLRLDKNLGDDYGTVAVEDVDAASLSRNPQEYYSSSYDTDFEKATAACWQKGCNFAFLDPLGFLLHDFSNARGASGSPLFYFAGQDHRHSARIVAINVGERSRKHETLYRVPFSRAVANVAVPSHEFYKTLQDVLAGNDDAAAVSPLPVTP